MKVTIIIPTYNERENIGPLLEALRRAVSCANTVLVVDDNSPDGTQEIVRREMKKWDNIRMITGEKRGLGAATVRGMRYAIEKLKAEVVVTMDADFSHNPEDVERLLAEIDRGADYVIGSRYIPGGSIPADWGIHRKFLSFFGNLAARILGVWKVHDLTPNFRAVRTALLEKIRLEDLPQGYAFQIALVCRARDAGAKFAEVPIRFADRIKGKSKMPARTIFETLGFLIKYRMQKLKAQSVKRKATTQS